MTLVTSQATFIIFSCDGRPGRAAMADDLRFTPEQFERICFSANPSRCSNSAPMAELITMTRQVVTPASGNSRCLMRLLVSGDQQAA